jgi:arsenate reductase (glutaredoxin)
MNTTLYGIPNCDTVKKARAWLAERGVEVAFHDYKKQGVPEAELSAWMTRVGWEKLLNRQGTTWRKLDPAAQAAVTNAASALALMRVQPSVIRRPVLVRGGELRVGFDAADWARLFA